MARSKSTTVTAKEPKGEDQVQANDKHDFFWTYTEEPHRTRRMAIIKAHPEVWIPCRMCPRCSSMESIDEPTLPPHARLIRKPLANNSSPPDHQALRSRAPD